MTKHEFSKHLTNIHSTGTESEAVTFLMITTRLGEKLCKEIIRNLWGCSNPKYVGSNILHLLEISASSDVSTTFKPKLKKGCSVYIVYPDEHAAIFALFKLKEYKNEGTFS
jgi:hypothetical protein